MSHSNDVNSAMAKIQAAVDASEAIRKHFTQMFCVPVVDFAFQGDAMRALGRAVAQISEAFQPLANTVTGIADDGARCQRIEDAGWVAHETNVSLGGGAEVPPAKLDMRLQHHYRENWEAVRATLSSSVNSYAIDDEAKAAYDEALRAHEAELFRCAPRLLFPEVERLSRQQLHDGELAGVTGQRKLREAVGGLTPRELSRHGMSGFYFYKRLTSELYAKVKTKDDIGRILSKPGTLNRHAALHGLMPYDTEKASINSLLVCDFLFGAVSAIVSRRTYESIRAE